MKHTECPTQTKASASSEKIANPYAPDVRALIIWSLVFASGVILAYDFRTGPEIYHAFALSHIGVADDIFVQGAVYGAAIVLTFLGAWGCLAVNHRVTAKMNGTLHLPGTSAEQLTAAPHDKG